MAQKHKFFGRLVSRTEINVFWPITEVWPWFIFIFFLTTIDPTHHTYNIQLTKNNFDEICFVQNSPFQPLPVTLSTPSPWSLFLPPLSLPTKTLAPPHQQHPCKCTHGSEIAEFGHRIQRCSSTQQIDSPQSPQIAFVPPMFRLPSPPPPQELSYWTMPIGPKLIVLELPEMAHMPLRVLLPATALLSLTCHAHNCQIDTNNYCFF